ncbi:MAG TPA: hypothetical protein VF710_20750 [Longimicrobium sp.]|jgi:hypothetical protein
MTDGEHPGAAAPFNPEVGKLARRIRSEALRLSDFAGLSIAEAADVIRHEPVEHALIFQPGGRALAYAKSRPETPKEVTIPMREARLLPGNIFLHNHPDNESFSYQDVWLLLRHGVREVRAYGPKRAFVMSSQPETRTFTYENDAEGLQALIKKYLEVQRETTPPFRELVRGGTFNEAEAWAAQTHGIMRTISRIYRFYYAEL